MEKEKLLLLHGALGSTNQFRKMKEGLEKHYEVYDLNFEGHGGTSSHHPFSIQLFTDNVIRFLRKRNMGQINIFGYSMGGYVGLYTALKFPDVVKRVITLGTKFDWSAASAQREVKMLNPETIERKVPHFAEKLKREHHPNDWKDLMVNTGKMMIDLSEGTKLSDENLKNIKQPVFIGIGDLDNMVSLEESKHAASFIPNSSLKILEGVQHPIEKNDPEVLISFIVSNGF